MEGKADLAIFVVAASLALVRQSGLMLGKEANREPAR